MPLGQLVTVARVADVPPGTIRQCQAGDVEVAVANVDGEIRALQPHCLHLGGPLGHGRLEGSVLTCPWHGWQYDVTTGENEFDHAIRLETYEVVVEDGEIKVAL